VYAFVEPGNWLELASTTTGTTLKNSVHRKMKPTHRPAPHSACIQHSLDDLGDNPGSNSFSTLAERKAHAFLCCQEGVDSVLCLCDIRRTW
jgi:hypothetical protein